MILIEKPSIKDLKQLHDLIRKHYVYTSSPYAEKILSNWRKEKSNFIKIIPEEYKRIQERNRNTKKQVIQ